LKVLETAADETVVETEWRGRGREDMASFVGKIEGLRLRDLDFYELLASYSRS
jgi:hypothetical protein